ncbi:nicotinate-nucleotide--dimethylbenzimidazole phosphoribosyltransferase [Streptomyces sp. NPDC087903]|uniref:nicotinate-nucleotide--dimethylbenzimidazole phosphoribosyltransferase n=1 Tax=Streptomyces sp. NPDC087903 TaxID=3365819 RepID=UPI0037F790BB
MTDTGQVPGEGLPESAGMVEEPGVAAHGAYTYLSETTAEDEDLLLLPGAQGAWGNEVAPPAPEPVVETVHEPGPHEMSGRDSGSVDLGGVRLPTAAPAPQSAPVPPRRPLHLGPPIPDASASPVRSLADRGPAGVPVRQSGPPTIGPEYLDVPHLRDMPPQGAAPWGAQAQATVQAPVNARVSAAETVVPATAQGFEPVGAAQTVVAQVAAEADAVSDPAVAEADAVSDPAVAHPATAEAVGGTGPHPAETEPVAQGPQGGSGAFGGYEGQVPASQEPWPAEAPSTSQDAPTGPEDAQAPVAGQELPASGAAPDAGDHTVPAAATEFAPDAVLTPEAGQVPGADAVVETQQGPGPEVPEALEGSNGVSASEAEESAFTAPAPDLVPAPEAALPPTGVPQDVEAAQAAQDVPVPGDPHLAAAEAAPALAPTTPPAVPAPETVDVSGDGFPEAAYSPEAAEPADDSVTLDTDAPAEEIPEEIPEPTLVHTEPEHTEPEHTEPEHTEPEHMAPPHEAVTEAEPVLAAVPAAVADGQHTASAQPEQGPQLVAAAHPVQAHHPSPDATPQDVHADAPPAATGPALTFTAPQTHAAEAPAPPLPPEAPLTPGAAPRFTEPAPQAEVLQAPAQPADTPLPHENQDQDVDQDVDQELVQVENAVAAPQDRAAPEAPDALAPAAPSHTPEHAGAPAEFADPVVSVPEELPAEAIAAAAVDQSQGHVYGESDAPLPATAPLPAAVPLEPDPSGPLGEFVPVEGSVPTAPHLAPTPPQPLVLPVEEEQPVAAVPAPREADPVPAPEPEHDPVPAPEPEHDPELVQHADDLDTRAADQEESTAAVENVRQSTGPAAPAYDDAEREAVLKVMRERRDIRNGFRDDPIPHEVLLRVLEAAHTAPSVGHSQPWDFVVIRSAETRRSMHELAVRQRDAYAKSLPKGRAKQFKELKIEAILDTPVNIVVTADPTRGGRHTLGRHTQPQMAPYSSALAVENLWLAARAEGLGVGWVSFFDEREMVRALGLPEHLEVVAYLCVGYVDEFPDEPELMQAGWSKRRPLSWVVHEETYGRRALPGEDPHDLLGETVAQIRPLDAKALGEAWDRQKRMTKPAGALGMLEIISAQLSGLSRQCPPPIPEPAAVAIFAGDHGVHAQGVTPWPQEVTAQMVANFLGGGAVCNAFATQVGAEVCVIDVGVAADLPATPGLLPRKIRAGTSDMTTGPAMTREEAKQAIEVGIETARDLVAAGNKALLTGEMGIANTTASAALISVFTDTDPAEVTGRGTGINDETLARKTEVVRRAIEVHQPDPADPIGVLAAIGGFEHAAIVGLLLGGASLRTPVILDGVSAGAAALVARAIAPEVLAACIAGHRSAEPGHVAALNKLGLRPLVDLDLRLGEGTGALLALPLVQSTARAMHEVATFDSAGVTEK